MISTLFRPWRRVSTWWAVVHIVLGSFFGIVSFVAMAVLIPLSVGLLPVFPGAVAVGWLLFMVAAGLGWLERSRVKAVMGIELAEPHGPLPAGSWWSKFKHRLKSGSRWREIGYLVLAGPLGIVACALAMAAWCGSLTLVALPGYVDALPGHRASFGLLSVTQGLGSVTAGVVGGFGLALVAPWLTIALARLQTAVAGGMIARRRGVDLEQRVTKLEASRVAALDTAEAERHRIERDLHDGAQQRLVSVAMDLGQAQEQFDHDPEHARQLVRGAHQDAKAALAELRQLVRGFHPAILEDRGLDAALSAIVARAPVPVNLAVDILERPSAAIESAAYFVVTEALTNMAKHSHATSVSVNIARRDDRLVVEVTDNGVGGADPDKGSGLRGLEERVSAHGGWMEVLSPPGGPTTLLVTLPCAS